MNEIINQIQELQESKIEVYDSILYTINSLLEENDIKEVKKKLKQVRSIFIQYIIDQTNYSLELEKFKNISN